MFVLTLNDTEETDRKRQLCIDNLSDLKLHENVCNKFININEKHNSIEDVKKMSQVELHSFSVVLELKLSDYHEDNARQSR